MIKILRDIFKGKKKEESKKYTSASDFFMYAPADEQKRVLIEAARRSNEDQMKVFKQAQKVKV